MLEYSCIVDASGKRRVKVTGTDVDFLSFTPVGVTPLFGRLTDIQITAMLQPSYVIGQVGNCGLGSIINVALSHPPYNHQNPFEHLQIETKNEQQKKIVSDLAVRDVRQYWETYPITTILYHISTALTGRGDFVSFFAKNIRKFLFNDLVPGASAYFMSDSISKAGATNSYRRAIFTGNLVRALRHLKIGKVFDSPWLINKNHAGVEVASIIQSWLWVPPENEKYLIRKPKIRNPELALAPYKEHKARIIREFGWQRTTVFSEAEKYLEWPIDNS